MYQNSSAVKDEILKSYIEQIFNTYDTQRTGKLNSNDITSFFNDLFRSVEVNITLNNQQSHDAIKAVFPNYTNFITKDELFIVFKVMLGLQSPPQTQPTIGINQFNGYNPTMISNPTFINPQNYYPNGNYQPNYMAQNYMLAQNLMRQQQQNLSNGYQQMNMGNYGQQNNNNNGQYRK